MSFVREIISARFALLLLTVSIPAFAQSDARPGVSALQSATGTITSPAPLRITLADAIARAQKLSPTLATALAQSRLAAGAATQARSAILPNVTGISQYLYTEGNGTLAARFIANNGVHEYIVQADVHQAISGPLLFQYRRAALLQAVANDQATLAGRGLLVAVVQAYSALYGAEGKLTTAQVTS
jgi:outer membrane protein TolC